MTLQQLRYVVEIADKGSMNEAAKCLYMAQPTLSGTIRELENEIGFLLFIRTNKGTRLTPEGVEFLAYSKQVLNQADALEERFLNRKKAKQKLSISSQHYTFVAQAFISLIRETDPSLYNFSLKEKGTAEIIEDIKAYRSEIGIMYINKFNEKMMNRYLKENHLTFVPLYEAKPHVFISSKSQLAKKKSVTLKDLEEYIYLYFDQKDTDPVYFSEEILSTMEHSRKIAVSDRATIFNLLSSLDSYTITTGRISRELNGDDLAILPLEVEEIMRVGYISLENSVLSPLAELYLKKLTEILKSTT